MDTAHACSILALGLIESARFHRGRTLEHHLRATAEREQRYGLASNPQTNILTRGALRVLLGRCLATPRGDIEFTYGPKGKLTLAAPPRIQLVMRPTGWLCGVAAAGEPAGLVHLAHATKAAAAWTLQDLHVLSAVDPVELLE